ncbi:sensor histidine kinase [Xylophilus ampelinus]|uniref:histidine kinase n=1 Tax=Xylophilus ampelinus TaxID=54067 RepID=A0A318SJG4_9BURK|nr:HAMP domain-containing sensor histidine kinase [Xylophilus ampelinus]MCS4509305.1 HAMP domain-containing histidine kinase [Xylophilus ampelinus]PYE79027.1 signal transduction histidine kinase [Xylophilus ampelinus]
MTSHPHPPRLAAVPVTAMDTPALPLPATAPLQDMLRPRRHPLRRHLRLALLLLPWLLAMGLGFPLLWQQMRQTFDSPVQRARDLALFQAASVAGRVIDSLRNDVRFLEAVSTLDEAAAALSSDSDTARLMLAFARGAPSYDHLRLVDADGRERLQVAYTAGPSPGLYAARGMVAERKRTLAPPDRLQNARNHIDFDRVSHLPQGEVYLSGLELRPSADGRPPQPVLRATAARFDGATLRGAVSLELLANDLLERIVALGRSHHVELLVAHPDGRWIRGPAAGRDWSDTVAATDPGLWAAMQAQADGLYRGAESGGEWTFRRIGLARELGAAAPPGRASPGPGLLLAARADRQSAAWARWRWQLPLAACMAAALFAAVVLSAQLLRSLRADARHTRALHEANRALTIANDNLRSVQGDLARAARLSSLGLMVAGVAHELNNPLGSATLALSTARQELDMLAARLRQGLRRSDLDRYVAMSDGAMQTVADAVRRAAGLVQRFKQVAVDRTSMQRRVFDLGQIVLDADPRLRHWPADGTVDLRLLLPPGLEMDSYPGPLEQAVSNLLDNAVLHAFGAQAAGAIVVEVAADGPDHVLVRVADDGVGIPAADLPQVFEPFFTTRRHAGGTGLGLHIVHQIVADVLGGTLWAESPVPAGVPVPGRGTVFTLRLPRRAPERPEAAVPVADG